jgi:hypothetical protein
VVLRGRRDTAGGAASGMLVPPDGEPLPPSLLVNSGGHVQRGGGEGAWCYVGGETRLVALRAGCSFRQMVSASRNATSQLQNSSTPEA